MHTLLIKNLNLVLTLAIILIAGTSFAQKTVTWKGGTPGMENDWHCPYNWSTGAVPDEFSNVIIPDVSTTSFSLPVIQEGEVEINQIIIHSNARLTIEEGARLNVLDHAELQNYKCLLAYGTFLTPGDDSTLAEVPKRRSGL